MFTISFQFGQRKSKIPLDIFADGAILRIKQRLKKVKVKLYIKRYAKMNVRERGGFSGHFRFDSKLPAREPE
ncbi:hypothetical protein [Oscillibacter sp. GMB15532]|uniref:hypothetical protein n=1 Tax=Oscillibacter sp. GMB15532 TaxID=3230022 RepID=UPI0034E007D5